MPEDQRFFSFIATINGHWPYVNAPTDSLGVASMALVNQADNDGTLWTNKHLRPDTQNVGATARMLYRHAMARMMTMDQGLQFLLDELDYRGLRDNTTLLIYTDHNAYGHDLKYIMTNTTRHKSAGFRVPAILWSPNVNGFKVDKFMSPVDLVPTLFDILDIVVNPRMYKGHNAFDAGTCVHFSRLGVVFNDVILTDGMYTLWEATHVTETHREAFRQAYADLIYRWSYINRLFYPGNEAFTPLMSSW
jgi:arylsulfatase A-like enzyme